MQNARSYLGRFSGLALFLIALLVVGLLVIFTVRSANDDNGTVSTEDGATTSQSEDSEEGSGNDQPVSVPDLDSTPAVRGGSDEGGQSGRVVSSEDGLPNTGPEDALIPAFVLGVLIFQGINWRQSRRQLAQTVSQSR